MDVVVDDFQLYTGIQEQSVEMYSNEETTRKHASSSSLSNGKEKRKHVNVGDYFDLEAEVSGDDVDDDEERIKKSGLSLDDNCPDLVVPDDVIEYESDATEEHRYITHRAIDSFEKKKRKRNKKTKTDSSAEEKKKFFSLLITPIDHINSFVPGWYEEIFLVKCREVLGQTDQRLSKEDLNTVVSLLVYFYYENYIVDSSSDSRNHLKKVVEENGRENINETTRVKKSIEQNIKCRNRWTEMLKSKVDEAVNMSKTLLTEQQCYPCYLWTQQSIGPFIAGEIITPTRCALSGNMLEVGDKALFAVVDKNGGSLCFHPSYRVYLENFRSLFNLCDIFVQKQAVWNSNRPKVTLQSDYSKLFLFMSDINHIVDILVDINIRYALFCHFIAVPKP